MRKRTVRRPATAEEVAAIFSTRYDELKALIGEPNANLTMPADGGGLVVLATSPQFEKIVELTINGESVTIPVQLHVIHKSELEAALEEEMLRTKRLEAAIAELSARIDKFSNG